jgi:hypothetical protein
MNRRDQDELRRLVDQAWDQRGTPYLVDACRAIEDWWERRYSRRLDRRDEDFADLIRLLERTDPGPTIDRRVAA